MHLVGFYYKNFIQHLKPPLYILLFITDSAFTVHVSNLVNVEFLLFIKSQFTTNSQSVLHLNQFAYGHVLSWTVTPFKRPCRLTMLWQTSKMLWCSVPTFSIGAEYSRNVGVFNGKNVQVWATVGAAIRTLFCGHTLIWNLFRCFVVGNWLLYFSQAF